MGLRATVPRLAYAPTYDMNGGEDQRPLIRLRCWGGRSGGGVGEEAGFFVVASGLAAKGGVAAMPGGATATNPPRITDSTRRAKTTALLTHRAERVHISRAPEEVNMKFRKRAVLYLAFTLLCIGDSATAQVQEGCEAELPFTVIERHTVMLAGTPRVKIYVHLGEAHFSRTNLERLFNRLTSEESAPLIGIIVLSDKENLERTIRFAKHPLLLTLMRSEEGEKFAEENYPEYIPDVSGYYQARYMKNRESTRYYYSPSKTDPAMVEVKLNSTLQKLGECP